ncbi:hypothetical protein [Candidatus Fukatsuia endosymbiont of Tuberolachnus salignus]|uniref:hypothetical protein n=1 Tax=Candidatus Fukatsuia endosymbiont of Tuberolachnus salignus TaxID=3077957 RepID=UPI00313B67C7
MPSIVTSATYSNHIPGTNTRTPADRYKEIGDKFLIMVGKTPTDSSLEQVKTKCLFWLKCDSEVSFETRCDSVNLLIDWLKEGQASEYRSAKAHRLLDWVVPDSRMKQYQERRTYNGEYESIDNAMVKIVHSARYNELILDLSGLNLTDTPVILQDKLQKLDLSNNQLPVFDTRLCYHKRDLGNLEEPNEEEDKIQIDGQFYAVCPIKVRELYLSGTSLSQAPLILPQGIGYLNISDIPELEIPAISSELRVALQLQEVRLISYYEVLKSCNPELKVVNIVATPLEKLHDFQTIEGLCEHASEYGIHIIAQDPSNKWITV